MKYKVEITEYLQKTIEVAADNKFEAISIVEDMYNNEEVVLSADNFIDKEFNIIED